MKKKADVSLARHFDLATAHWTGTDIAQYIVEIFLPWCFSGQELRHHKSLTKRDHDSGEIVKKTNELSQCNHTRARIRRDGGM